MNQTKSYLYPLSIIALLFFVFGFLTSVNGILIPYFQICLQLNNFQASLVAFAAFIAYFIMALPAAQLLKMTGYKKGMVLGLMIMAAGTALFIPAARSRTYGIFLTGLFVTGAGLTLLQTAVNPYVAIIGPIKSTAQRIGFMGLANKVAGILSISVLGSIFLFNADTIIARVKTVSSPEKANILNAYSLKIAHPYLIITLILLLLAVIIYLSGMPEIDDSVKNNGETDTVINHKPNIFHYPYLVMGVLVLFFSSACEGIPVDGIILYGRSLGIPIEMARHFTTYTLCAMLAGYLASTVLIPKYLSQHNALLGCSVYGLILSVLAYLSGSLISMYCLVLMGVGSAMFWGTIWGLSIRELGKYTKIGSAMLLMSVIGGGIFPLIFGRLIDANPLHPQNSLLLLIPCYCILLFFSGWGYRIESWRVLRSSKKVKII